MSRPLDLRQQHENRAFLRALERTGNVRLAARETGIAYGTVQHRRRGHPAFAQRWDAALAAAAARLAGSGPHRPERAAAGDARRTRGGEAVVIRLGDGRCQVRRAQPGKLTHQCEQAFLLALSATANVRLSAAAAGAAEAAFYRRRRRHPGFAREWRLALAAGYERIELALLEAAQPEAHRDDDWRRNDPPPIPPMTANQALQLLYLHQKEARLLAEPAHLKRRRGEPPELWSFRLAAMVELARERDREAFRLAEAARRAAGGRAFPDAHLTTAAPDLPDLAQVTGWSKADPAKVPHDPDRALFGGWRIGNVTARERE